jgi:anaerobic magnesium-protoporphyrin IX monomethyl ester cyclase
VGFVDFEDENLTMDRRWFLSLMEGIREIFGEALPELRAMNGLFPPSLTETVIGVMKKTGFKTLNLSLGSADRRQLERFNRPDVRAAFDRALECARREGLSAVGYIIVGAPDQDPLSSVDDLLFLARRRVLAGVSVFYPAPGSADYGRCRELGLLPSSVDGMRATALPIDQRTSRTDSVTLLRLARILNFRKHLIATGVAVPQPAPVEGRVDPTLDRQEIGLKLLAAFLMDGGIRGIEADGTVYDHRVSARLCRRFSAGWQAGPMRGVLEASPITTINPKPPSTTPETRLIQRMPAAFMRPLNRLLADERMIHQAMEPEKTPATRPPAAICPEPALPSPMPANTAAKERMVMGLVRVRKKAER